MRFFALFFIFLFPFLAVAQKQQAAAKAHGTKWQSATDALVKPIMDKQKAPTSIVVGVVTPQGSEVFGYSKSLPKPDGDTIFMIGSVQKLFAGVLFGDMISQGVVKAEQPLQSLLPKNVQAPTFDGTEITLEQMATFTSGLPDSAPGFRRAIRKSKTPLQVDQAIYSFLKSYSLTRKPGSQYEYSNISAAMLANVLSHKLGKPFHENVQERILTPLEMKDTGMYFDKASSARIPAGYNSKTWKQCASPTSNPLSETGSPQMHSTLNDMIKFVRAHLGITSPTLSAPIHISMVPRAPLKAPNKKSAFFWSVTRGNRYFKNGLLPKFCFSTVVVMDTTTKTGVVVLSNTTDFGIDAIGTKLLTEMNKY